MISVIIPVYNVEKYLEKCLESVCNQTYKDLEIILIDDGSTDSSGSICDRYAKLDSRVKVIHRENMGLAYTRNQGLDLASGEYIAWCDSDDYWHPQMLELLMDMMTKEDAEVACCKYIDVPESYKENFEYIDEQTCKFSIYENEEEKLDFIYRKYNLLATTIWNKLYKASLWEGVRAPKGIRIYEDETMTFIPCYNANRLVFVDKELYFRLKREDGSSITDQGFSPKRLERLKSLEYRVQYFEEKRDCRFLAQAFFAYKEDLLVIMKQIEKSKEYDGSMLKPYMSDYRRDVRKYMKSLPGSYKSKMHFVVFALFPKLYFQIYKSKH